MGMLKNITNVIARSEAWQSQTSVILIGNNEIATSSAKGGLLAMKSFGIFCSETEFFNTPLLGWARPVRGVLLLISFLCSLKGWQRLFSTDTFPAIPFSTWLSTNGWPGGRLMSRVGFI